MILLTLLLIGVCIAEMKLSIKKEQKKEMAVFFTSVMAALAIGFYYLSDPNRNSFAQILLDILQVSH